MLEKLRKTEFAFGRESKSIPKAGESKIRVKKR